MITEIVSVINEKKKLNEDQQDYLRTCNGYIYYKR